MGSKPIAYNRTPTPSMVLRSSASLRSQNVLRMTPYEHLDSSTMHSRQVDIVSYGVVVEKTVSRNQSGGDLPVAYSVANDLKFS